VPVYAYRGCPTSHYPLYLIESKMTDYMNVVAARISFPFLWMELEDLTMIVGPSDGELSPHISSHAAIYSPLYSSLSVTTRGSNDAPAFMNCLLSLDWLHILILQYDSEPHRTNKVNYASREGTYLRKGVKAYIQLTVTRH
jgi:hypothetical protein